MECRRCGSSLERPGDFCLVCREANADTVVLEAGRDRATITMLEEDRSVGETTITTVPEDGEAVVVELRNFVGRIADEIRRKRPEEVYADGERAVLRGVRGELHYPFYRIDGEDQRGRRRHRRTLGLPGREGEHRVALHRPGRGTAATGRPHRLTRPP